MLHASPIHTKYKNTARTCARDAPTAPYNCIHARANLSSALHAHGFGVGRTVAAARSPATAPVSYTHLRAHETLMNL
eukprot:2324662-Prymnesium_polylepis.1